MQPLFLLSLPRSGSTFLQRLLATHPEIATTSEPWILLPLLYALRRHGIFTEYGQGVAARAIEDFCTHLPGGAADCRAALAGVALDLYARAGGAGRRYFLDKTPRYHLLVDDLFELFPDARFIFLWRNPLAIAASMIETWGDGRWNLHRYAIDLEVGLGGLVEAYERQRGRALAIRYEDLARDPEATLGRAHDYLGLDYDRAALERFPAVELTGRFGDPSGGRRSRAPSVESVDKWTGVMANPLRRAWSRRYLGRIGRHRLEAMGYDPDALRATVDRLPRTFRRLGSDGGRYLYGIAHGGLELRLMKAKWLATSGRPRLVSHA